MIPLLKRIRTLDVENIVFLYEGESGNLAIFRLCNVTGFPIDKQLGKGKVVFIHRYFKRYLEEGKTYSASGNITQRDHVSFELFYPREIYLISESGEKTLTYKSQTLEPPINN